VYGRPFVNQIEIIRALAMSLPADMVLVTKEHPWMVGKRSMSTYRALLNIPRVHLVSPDVEARELILGASLVAVVTGSVALEAAMLGKPVVTFGDCPYNALPPTMVQRCQDLRRLPDQLRRMIQGYANDEHALESYVAATWDTSEGINLYSVLLQKKGVYRDHDTTELEEIEKLADYVVRCVSAAKRADCGTPEGSARW
jgi:CDP-glycerol glycerophosphotransferase (TagB/SpsB family)